jgi:isoleucyl-tRNA synthetase
MNAIKDRLYCNPINDGRRQGAVFTLKTILNSMLPLIAPLFTYTAQEAFEYCSDEIKGKAKDIFDLVYFDPPKYSSYNPLLDGFDWEKALKDFHYHFDLLKKEGHMKDTLEVSLECPKELHFDGAEDWFVVGRVSEHTDKPCLASWDNFRIVKSDLNKCNRCWKRNVPAGLEIAECNRCSKVLKDLK